MDSQRKIRRVSYSRKFLKKITQLPNRLIAKAKAKEKLFVMNPFDARLGTHKLHGKEREQWAFWIDYHYRIKFIFLNDEEVLFTGVGTHDEVY